MKKLDVIILLCIMSALALIFYIKYYKPIYECLGSPHGGGGHRGGGHGGGGHHSGGGGGMHHGGGGIHHGGGIMHHGGGHRHPRYYGDGYYGSTYGSSYGWWPYYYYWWFPDWWMYEPYYYEPLNVWQDMKDEALDCFKDYKRKIDEHKSKEEAGEELQQCLNRYRN